MAIIPDWLLVTGDSSKKIIFYNKSIDKKVRQKFANGVFWVSYGLCIFEKEPLKNLGHEKLLLQKINQ